MHAVLLNCSCFSTCALCLKISASLPSLFSCRCKKVFKVYNCAHKRWEAALVLRQQRHLRRASLLRIRNDLQNQILSPDVPASRTAGQPAHGSLSRDAKQRVLSNAIQKKTTRVGLSPKAGLLEYKTRVSLRRQAIGTSTSEELAVPSPRLSNAKISKSNVTTPPPPACPLRNARGPVIPSLRLGYDREILGLVKCSELATGMPPCGPLEKACDTSPQSPCIVSSAGGVAIAEGSTCTPFPHFLTVRFLKVAQALEYITVRMVQAMVPLYHASGLCGGD